MRRASAEVPNRETSRDKTFNSQRRSLLPEIIPPSFVRFQTDEGTGSALRCLTGSSKVTAAMADDLTLLQIAMHVGMSCAFTAVAAAGTLMVFRISAWLG
jgi:hypothetical protein